MFQRTYSWTKAQWDDPWKDIVETYEPGNEPHHFLGPVVTKSLPGAPDQVSPFLVIDGQQRLTILTILLAALRDAIHSTDETTAAKIHDLYLTNRYVSGLSTFKILPRQADREAYFSVITRAREQASHGSSRILDCYKYFCDKIGHSDEDDVQGLNPGRLEGPILNLELVSITIDERDNEYRSFESLNAKGASPPLTQADLLRNYFFMRISWSRQDIIYRTIWLPLQQLLGDHLEDFFRYLYMSDGEFVRESDVYQKWKITLDKLTSDQLLERLRNIAQAGSYYKRLTDPVSEADPEVSGRLVRLNRWGSQTMYPFLLLAYGQEKAGYPGPSGIAELLTMIESFLVRRLFCGVPTNALNRLFLRVP